MMQYYIDESNIPHTYDLAPPSTATGLLQEFVKTGMEVVDQDSYFSAMTGNLAGLLGNFPAAAAPAMSAEENRQNFALLSGITTSASIGEDAASDTVGYGKIVRSEEPYHPWTLTGSMNSSAQPPCAHTGFQDMPEKLNIFIELEQYLEQFRHVEEAGPGQGLEELEKRIIHEWSSKQLPLPITTQFPWEIIQEGLQRGDELLEAETIDLTKQSAPMSLLSVQIDDGLDKIAFGCNQNIVANIPGGDLHASPLVASSLPNLNNQTISPSLSCMHGTPASTEQVPGRRSSRSAFQVYAPAQSTRLSQHSMSSNRKPMIHYWVEKFGPKLKSLQVLQPSSSDQSAVGLGNCNVRVGTSYDFSTSISAAHDFRQALVRKKAEQQRRNKFKRSLESLKKIVPTITKKDKVAVIYSAIEYIRQLESRISSLKKELEEAAPGFLDMENSATLFARGGVNVSGEQDLGLHYIENPAGPSSSPATTHVVVEGTEGGETLNLRVEANYHARSLPKLLNVLQDLDVVVVAMDYGCKNERFRATVRVKTSRNVRRSNHELEQTLCRALEVGGLMPPSRSQQLF